MTTVTTDAFVPGTLVTLHSFLTCHPGFDGDLLVIHDGLAETGRAQLARLHDRVVFVPVAAPLRERVRAVVSAIPAFASRQARFYSLDCFRLRGWDKVVFCDSDLLFRQAIDDLFERPEPLIACGDGPYYRGQGRVWHRPGEIGSPDGGALKDTFNAGLLVVGREFLTDGHYEGLIELVDGRTFEGGSIPQTDQVVLNLHFAGRQHLVGPTYNYLLAHRTAIAAREGLPAADARVLHFNGPGKPWVPDNAHDDPEIVAACGLWRAAYVDGVRALRRRAATVPAPSGDAAERA